MIFSAPSVSLSLANSESMTCAFGFDISRPQSWENVRAPESYEIARNNVTTLRSRSSTIRNECVDRDHLVKFTYDDRLNFRYNKNVEEWKVLPESVGMRIVCYAQNPRDRMKKFFYCIERKNKEINWSWEIMKHDTVKFANDNSPIWSQRHPESSESSVSYNRHDIRRDVRTE